MCVCPIVTSRVIQMRPSQKSWFTEFSKAEKLDSSEKPFLLPYEKLKSLSELPQDTSEHQSSTRIAISNFQQKDNEHFSQILWENKPDTHKITHTCRHTHTPTWLKTPSPTNQEHWAQILGSKSSIKTHQKLFPPPAEPEHWKHPAQTPDNVRPLPPSTSCHGPPGLQ